METRAQIYIRTNSSNGQANDAAVQRQKERLQNIAEQMSWQICSLDIDCGIAASKYQLGLERIKAAASNKEFDVLLVASLDRISRDPIKAYEFLSEMSLYKIPVYSPGGKTDELISLSAHQVYITTAATTPNKPENEQQDRLQMGQTMG